MGQTRSFISPEEVSIPELREPKSIDGDRDRDSGEFLCFLRLPSEIRLMVYKEMTRARRVHLVFNTSRTGLIRKDSPSTLHLNSEARYEALKQYDLHFGSSTYPPNIHFNPSIDTLFFSPNDSQPRPCRKTFAPVLSTLSERWPCQSENRPRRGTIQCIPGCGHAELDFFWTQICSTIVPSPLVNVGLDIRINQADLLHALSRLENRDLFPNLRRITLYYAVRKGDVVGVMGWFGWKVWQITGFVKEWVRDDVKLIAEEFVIPEEDMIGESMKGLERNEAELRGFVKKFLEEREI